MADPVVHLFDGPYVVIDGRRVDVPEGSKRLLVLVALGGTRVERRAAACTLWSVGNEERAAGNLRSALWRLRSAGIDLVEADKHALRLSPGTAVDLHVVCARATRLISGVPHVEDLDLAAWRTGALELLPGWYDDWVVFERERLRQRLLHGLEALSRHLSRADRCGEAVEAAMRVVGVDPLRESAQRVLIEAHLAEGNVVEARRTYESYRVLAARELGVLPGAAVTALVRPPDRTRLTVVRTGPALPSGRR
jgi:DNA-binding SARP family transcriptional activator